MIIFLSLWIITAYAPVTHWVWGEEIYQNGMFRFTRGLVVHALAGVGALVTAVVIGFYKKIFNLC